MKASEKNVYIRELQILQNDLNTVIKTWTDDDFKKAEEIAKAALALVVGEINRLNNVSIEPNPSNPTMKLQSNPEELQTKLEQLCALMKKEDQRKFAEYIVMLDSLISDPSI